MAEFFSAADVVDAAVETEKRGREAYRRLALAATDPDVKALFESLAVEEARHEQLYAAMAKRIGTAPLPAGSATDEYAQYVAALLDSHLLFSPGMVDDLYSRAGDMQAALHGAMRLEKDTLVFFQEMMALVPKSEQGHVEECIEEERRHLHQLSALLAK